mmetsp:Transcript_738/g.2243  ORF Transcript_738/g.2243 Transcript_738/m.2243 type:complete len:219 (-) Transcript_738:393-1049(-)
MAAEALEAVGLAVGEGAVCKQGSGNRLEGEPDAELLNHVPLAAVVEVDLDRAGAEHHVQAHGAHSGHVRLHQLVAALWHHRDVLHRPLRVEPHSKEAHSHLLGNGLCLVEVAIDLSAGFVDAVKRGTAELKLATRLQGDALSTHLAANDAVPLHHGLPPEAVHYELEELLDLRVVGAGVVIRVEHNFLVLCPDPPVRFWLAAAGNVGHEVLLGKHVCL